MWTPQNLLELFKARQNKKKSLVVSWMRTLRILSGSTISIAKATTATHGHQKAISRFQLESDSQILAL